MAHALYLTNATIESRINKISASDISNNKLKRGNIKPYENLKIDELLLELKARGVKLKQHKPTLAQLQQIFHAEMCGIQRAPALLVYDPFGQKSLNLSEYEILPNEPMHDLTGHLKNLYEELPRQLCKAEQKLFNETLSAVFEGKQAKRACDYRLSLVKLCIHLNGKIDHKIHELLRTMCDMQELLYLSDNERSKITILRYYTQWYQHTMNLKKLVGCKPKANITQRKFYGKYFHALLHAGMQLRIISGSSTNTEQQERTFNAIKTITDATSNHNPENLIFNAWIRMQVKECNENKPQNIFKSLIGTASKSLPPKENTVINFEHISRNKNEWQAFLEKCIPDYIVQEGLWWREAEHGIELFDVTNNNQNHYNEPCSHFRSSTIQSEERRLEKLWNQCVKNHSIIPACSIKVESNDVTSVIQLSTIKYFNTEYLLQEEISNKNKSHEESFPSTLVNENNMYLKQVALDKLITSNQTENINNNHVTPLKKSQSTITSTPITESTDNEDTNTKTNLGEEINNEEEKIVTLQIVDHSLHEVIDDNVLKSSSSRLLQKILGQSKLISQYDKERVQIKIRQKNKNNKTVSFEHYKTLLAKIEVKLVNKKSEVKKSIAEIEQQTLSSTTSMNVVPTKDSSTHTDYISLLKSLEMIRVIRKQLSI